MTGFVTKKAPLVGLLQGFIPKNFFNTRRLSRVAIFESLFVKMRNSLIPQHVIKNKRSHDGGIGFDDEAWSVFPQFSP